MLWLHKILLPGSVASGLTILSFAIVLGLIKIRGAGLGVAAVFFSALLLSAPSA